MVKLNLLSFVDHRVLTPVTLCGLSHHPPALAKLISSSPGPLSHTPKPWIPCSLAHLYSWNIPSDSHHQNQVHPSWLHLVLCLPLAVLPSSRSLPSSLMHESPKSPIIIACLLVWCPLEATTPEPPKITCSVYSCIPCAQRAHTHMVTM